MRPLSQLSRPIAKVILAATLAVVGAGAGAGAIAPVTAAAAPAGPSAPAPAPTPIDAYVPYQGQSVCDPTVKPGAKYLVDLLIKHYGVGRSSGITRSCTTGGQSEHKEGRAVDWAVHVDKPHEKAAADAFVAWLTAKGPDGQVGYNARRLGVMYVIWNRQIWNNSSTRAGWRAYTGASPHIDHVHISLGWNGAYMRSSWWTGTAIPEEATTRRYVSLVYGDLFDRAPDASGLTTWTRALTQGTPRGAVADAITYSTEYRSGLITDAYQNFLGRSPDPAGMTNWLAAMRSGLTIQTMEAGFLASTEYYVQSGNDDARWVQRLYQHVLARGAAPSEVQSWVDELARGRSRQSVALGFLLSTERLSTVINGYYQDLLGRSIDEVGRRQWVTMVQTGTRTESIIGGIVASPEYYGKAERFGG